MLTIGDRVFNSYSLRTPLDDLEAKGSAQPIPADSPLLKRSPAAGNYKGVQHRGAKLFGELLGHLDTIARFSRPAFTAALLRAP